MDNMVNDVHYEIIESQELGIKKVKVTFTLNGVEQSRIYSIKEGENVNYLDEAKKLFNQEIAPTSSNNSETTKPTPESNPISNPTPSFTPSTPGPKIPKFWKNPRFLPSVVAVLGALSVVFFSLFIWKATASQSNPPEPLPVYHYVTFESNGGSHIDTLTVKDNETIAEPTAPTRMGYEFKGWFTANIYEEQYRYVFSTKITDNLTLYAGWDGISPTITRHINFSIPNCKMYYGSQQVDDGGIDITIPNVNPYYVKFSVKADDTTYMKPGDVTLKNGTTPYLDYSFDKDNGDLLINLQSNISVSGSCDTYKSLEECSWSQIDEISQSGNASKAFKIGETKTVKLLNAATGVEQSFAHKVRIIGFDHDYSNPEDKENSKIGITFEFADLISDDKGHSLALLWNDVNDNKYAHCDYLNSSIRKALNGTGEATQVLWAQKGVTDWYADYKDKTVLNDILPEALRNVLKAPVKYVACSDDQGATWNDKIIQTNSVNDKLFLLSSLDLFNVTSTKQESSEHTSTYFYYARHTETSDNIRVKKQINATEVLQSSCDIPIDKGQLYQGHTAYNYAGHNIREDYSHGGNYWLRTPLVNSTNSQVYALMESNAISAGYGTWGYDVAYSIAPAFCI